MTIEPLPPQPEGRHARMAARLAHDGTRTLAILWILAGAAASLLHPAWIIVSLIGAVVWLNHRLNGPIKTQPGE